MMSVSISNMYSYTASHLCPYLAQSKRQMCFPEGTWAKAMFRQKKLTLALETAIPSQFRAIKHNPKQNANFLPNTDPSATLLSAPSPSNLTEH